MSQRLCVVHNQICFLPLIAFVLFLNSCNSTIREKDSNSDPADDFERLYNLADSSLAKNPDSAVAYATRAMIVAGGQKIPAGSLLRAFRMMANAQLAVGHPDSSIYYLEMARLLAESGPDSLVLCDVLLQLSKLHIDNGDIYIAEKHLGEAVSLIGGEMSYEKGVACNYFGSIYAERGDYEQSISRYLEAYLIFDSLGVRKALSGVLVNIGNSFKAIGSTSKAIYYYRRAVSEAIQSGDTFNQIGALRNLGILYRHTHPDSAMCYLLSADSLEPMSDNPMSAVIGEYNIANIYLDQNKLDKAWNLYTEVYASSIASGTTAGVIRAYSGMAAVKDKRGQYDTAVGLIRKAICLADSAGETSLRIDLARQLFDANKKSGRLAEALLVLEQLTGYKDSLLTIEKQTAVHRLERAFRTEEKSMENKMLKTYVLQQNKMLRARKWLIIVLITGALILAILLWRVYVLYIEKWKAYNALIAKYRWEREGEKHFESSARRDQPADASRLKTTSSESVFEHLIEYFQNEKPYLDPKLKVETVAEHLNTSQRNLATALKFHQQANFNAFLNHMRVEEAKRLFNDPKYRNYTIAAISQEAGFGSKQSFYNAFELITGIRPATYRRMMNQGAKE